MISGHQNKVVEVDDQLKTDSFEQLFRQYLRLVKERYYATEAAPPNAGQVTDAGLPFGVTDHTIPIWVVDDNPDVPILMRMVFNRIAPVVSPTFLTDGDELIVRLNEAPAPPNVILLDLFMKRIDGFDALRHVRAHTVYGQLPVVVLTSSYNEEDRIKALALGADDFLIKPLAFDHTISMIGRLVERWS